MRKKVKILGVRFDAITQKDCLKQIENWAHGDAQHYITTPNPEIVLKAHKDKEFKEILNQSSLNVADGTGTILVSRLKHGKVLPERITGTDLMKQVIEKSSAKIFLLGAAPGVAEKVRDKFSNTNITGCFAGSPNEKDSTLAVEKINNSKAQILFVAFGAPKQEKWIAENLKKLKTVRVAIGVGGAFDFHAGKIKRAPARMRKLGLEWLYRLFKQPSRIKRIYNAVIKFPITALFNR